MPDARLPRVLLVTGFSAAFALAAVIAGAPGEAAPSYVAAKPSLQHLSSLDHSTHGSRLTNVAWAAGRAWFVVGSLRGITIASARVQGTTLASQATTRTQVPLGWYPIVVGSDVLYSTTRRSSGISELLANGKVGPAKAASPEPMETEKGVPVAAVRLGSRLVWALAGGVPIGDGMNFKTTLATCCDDTGAAVDLTSLITSRPAPRDHALGVDSQGRIWLAWIDHFGAHGEARIVQLDPTTLARQTSKALVAPVSGPLGLKLACAATCRLVLLAGERRSAGGYRQYLASWAPGERSPTRINLEPDPEGWHEHPWLLAADYRSGRLAVAYTQGSSDRGPTLKVVVGDARGNRARPAGTVKLPGRFSGLAMWSFSDGAFTPAGFVFAQEYSNAGSRVVVAATVVPLR